MSGDVPVSAGNAGVSLTEAQVQTVRGVFDAVMPGAQVWVFGSRATGRARPFSDLDLLVAPALDWVQRAALRDAFERSDLPFRVDLVEADGLSVGFAARVNAERKQLPAT